VAEATPTPRSTASAAPSVSSVPTPTPLAIPEYGPLEMVYLGRSAPLAHIFLLRHDFTVQGEPEVLAQDPDLDVRSVAWSPDGTYGAGLYADLLISIEPGAAKRRLADGISAITFGPDPATLYAVRVTQDGTNDVAAVLSFDYATGDATEIASVSYARPSLGTEDAATEAQFIDDGGPIRLFWMESGVLRLWILGGGVWEMPPAGGEATKRDVDVPLLYASRSNRQVVVAEDGTTSTLSMLNGASETVATTSVEGLVSHLRWSPSGDRVVFTLARTAAGGGVLQDLFLWDLGDGEAPTQLTATGAAFSAEWLGATPLWRE
jgi:WD40 repeat protein